MPNCAEEMVAPVVGRDEFIAAKLLHNESGDAHAHASAQNGEQSGQAGDHKDLQLVQITG